MFRRRLHVKINKIVMRWCYVCKNDMYVTDTNCKLGMIHKKKIQPQISSEQ